MVRRFPGARLPPRPPGNRAAAVLAAGTMLPSSAAVRESGCWSRCPSRNCPCARARPAAGRASATLLVGSTPSIRAKVHSAGHHCRVMRLRSLPRGRVRGPLQAPITCPGGAPRRMRNLLILPAAASTSLKTTLRAVREPPLPDYAKRVVWVNTSARAGRPRRRPRRARPLPRGGPPPPGTAASSAARPRAPSRRS
jgi:hypothetical protein